MIPYSEVVGLVYAINEIIYEDDILEIEVTSINQGSRYSIFTDSCQLFTIDLKDDEQHTMTYTNSTNENVELSINSIDDIFSAISYHISNSVRSTAVNNINKKEQKYFYLVSRRLIQMIDNARRLYESTYKV